MRAESLGDRLQKAGVIDAPTLEALVGALRDRLRSGTPTSLGRLLLERGIPSTRILAVATSGERAADVRCEACSTVQMVPISAGREFPCSRCGAYLLPLGPVSEGGRSTVLDAVVIPIPPPTTPAGGDEPNEDPTLPLGGGATVRFDGVLPVPGAKLASSGTTLAFKNVLPLPGEVGAPSSGTTLAFNKVLPVPGPPLPGPEDPTQQLGGLGGGIAALPPPMGGVGVPPTINARPVNESAHRRPAQAFPMPAPAPGASFAPGVPPILNAPGSRSSSGDRRLPPADMDSEAPTVADDDGGAFAATAAQPYSPQKTTTEAKNPLAPASASRERKRAEPVKPASGRNSLVILAVVMSVIALASLAVLAYAIITRFGH